MRKLLLKLGVAAAAVLASQGAAAQTDVFIDPAARLQEIAAALPGQAGHDAVILRAERAALLVQLDRLDDAEAEIRALEAEVPATDKAALAEVAMARSVLHANRQENVDGTSAARRALELRSEIYGAGSAEAALAQILLAKLLISQGLFDEAIPLASSAWDRMRGLRAAGDSDRLDVGFQYAIGLVYSRQSEQAEIHLRTLLAELAATDAHHAMRAKLPQLMGTELLMQGRSAESIPYLAQAVEAGQDVRAMSLGERADHISTYAVALLWLDRPDDALPLFEQAADMFGQAGAIPSQSGNWLNAGTAADRAGDREKALEYRLRGMRLVEGMGDQNPLAVALNQFKLAQSLAHVGQLEQAEAMEQTAVDVIATFRPAHHFQTLNSRIALGWIKALRGDVQGGLALVKPAFRASVAVNNALEVSQNRVIDVLSDVEAFSQALEAARLAGDQEFVFEIMQVMIESDASRAAVAVSQREQAGEGELGHLLKQRQEAGAVVAEADSALLKAESEGQGVEAARAELAQSQAGLDARDAALDRAYPAFRDLLRPRIVTLAEVQHALAADDAVLLVNESDLGIYTLAITREAVTIGHAPVRRQALRQQVAGIRSTIDSVLNDGDPSFDVEGAARLHDAIFTPAIAQAVAGRETLRFATGDILSSLPLSLLVSRAGQGVADSRFLIEDHAITIVPSLAALAAAPDHTGAGMGTGMGTGLVAVGAPDLGSDVGRALIASRGDLAPLPGARAEMEQVARLLVSWTSHTILTGAAATESAVKALDLSGVGVLLFATHGLVAGRFDEDSEPALVLTPPLADSAQDDGLLTASEAAALNIGADWVILSACNTAAGDRPSAAGYTGLARGFLFAGAKRVVASHWPVRDDISARLSVGIVAASQAGATPAQALRRAVLAVKRDYPDPALWAPFMVIAR